MKIVHTEYIIHSGAFPSSPTWDNASTKYPRRSGAWSGLPERRTSDLAKKEEGGDEARAMEWYR